MAARLPVRGKGSFAKKLVAAVVLVAIADGLFFFQRLGSTTGAFAFTLLICSWILHSGVRRRLAAVIAILAAATQAAVMTYDPNLLAGSLFVLALTVAVLIPRTKRFDDAWRWTQRICVHLGLLWLRPIGDLILLRKTQMRRRPLHARRIASLLLLPMIGSLVFLLLFASANPLIEDFFAALNPSLLLSSFTFLRLGFWLVAGTAVWSIIRPAARSLTLHSASGGSPRLPGVNVASVTLSLLAFNAVFALQNILDLIFLWSGAPLPSTLTLAEYAHRGAYPLIITALLAGLFVLVTLSPDSEMAKSPRIRLLVYAWIAQNVFLVASTMLRTIDYVEAYSLTRLRIAALIWMMLVCYGLVLICIRIWRRKSAVWLINANAAGALATLALCSYADLGSAAASWNVRHAREVGGSGAQIDLCYLGHLEASSLLALIELEQQPLTPSMRERVNWTRNRIMDRLETEQADWHGWTIRNARRLQVAQQRIARNRLPRHAADRRPCGGAQLQAQIEMTAPPATPGKL